MKIRFGYVSPSAKGYKGAKWVTDPKVAYDMAIGECKGRSIYISYGNRRYIKINLEYLENLINYGNSK